MQNRKPRDGMSRQREMRSIFPTAVVDRVRIPDEGKFDMPPDIGRTRYSRAGSVLFPWQSIHGWICISSRPPASSLPGPGPAACPGAVAKGEHITTDGHFPTVYQGCLLLCMRGLRESHSLVESSSCQVGWMNLQHKSRTNPKVRSTPATGVQAQTTVQDPLLSFPLQVVYPFQDDLSSSI